MSRGRNLLLSLTAAIGGLCLAWTLLASVGGLTPLVVLSGSMSPSIETGALAVAREVPAAELRVGDVVSVENEAGARVTHRVTDARPETAGVVALTLQGDANATPDPETYRVTSAERVWFDVPVAGRVVQAVSSPAGLLAGFVLVGLALWSAAGRRDDDHDDQDATPRGGRRKADTGRRGGRVLVGAVAVVAAGAVGSQVAPVPTFAAFSDTGAAATAAGAVASATVTSQAQPACESISGLLTLGDIARLTFPQVDSRYEYAWEVRRGSTVVSSGVEGSGVARGSTVTINASIGLFQPNGNLTAVVQARLASSTSWVAAATTSTPVRKAGGGLRCGNI